MPSPESSTPLGAVPSSDSAPRIKRYYLLIFQSNSETDSFGDFNHAVFDLVHQNLVEQITTPPEETEIDIWLESGGGNAHVAYKLFLDLQPRCRRLRTVIPDYAKSAATLLALGTDEIFMNFASELGPIDAQIDHPDREGTTVSALDVAMAIGFLGSFAADFIVSEGHKILIRTELPRLDVLREMTKFTARFLAPVVSKLDPHLVHSASSQLDVAQRYAKIMLHERRVPENEKMDDKQIKLLVKRLVEDYPAHGFVISQKEAAALGLPARLLSEYDKAKEMTLAYESFRELSSKSREHQSLIALFDDESLAMLDQQDDQGESDEHNQENTDNEHENT